MKKLNILILFSVAAFTSFAQSDDSLFIRRLADQILVNGKAYDDLRVLTKQVGHRLAGSAGMYKAEQWGLKTMQSAGADKAWLQECMVPHWVRGGQDKASATYSSANGKGKSSTKQLDVIALGNSVGTMVPMTADVMEVKNFTDLEAKKDQVKGKIVFYNYPFDQRFVHTFNAYGDAVAYRGLGPDRASKYGAKAVIIRSMSESTDNAPHTGGTGYRDSVPKIPAVAIGLRDADWLSETIKNGPTKVMLHTHGKQHPDTVGHSVIGEIRGSEFPNEYITIGGHLDSWDVGEGAHDDGAGCVQTIEILRAFKALGYKPKRTIRFVLFANEENGLRGGTKYAEQAKANNEKHILALESDEGGFTPRGFGLTGTEAQVSKFLGWQPLLAPYGASELKSGGGGADIGPLARTQNTATVGYNPDSQRYFDMHHSRNDVFENVNKRELELGAVNMAALVYLVDKYGL